MSKHKPVTVDPSAHHPGSNAHASLACGVCALPLTIKSAIDELLMRREQIASTRAWALKNFPDEVAGLSYRQFYNHAREHVQVKVRAMAKLSDADKMNKREVKLAKKILNDEVDPQTYFAPAQLAVDIKRTSDRLETASDMAMHDGQFGPLASLGGVLVRTMELRGRLGGAISERPEMNVVVSISQIHEKLDGILSGDHADRQNAAKALLGITTTAGSWSGPVVDASLEDDDALALEAQRVDPKPR
jgi:hypothetical protein